jgi:hypothetical protein
MLSIKINEKVLTSSFMLEILISFGCKPKILENIIIICQNAFLKIPQQIQHPNAKLILG